MREDPVVKAAEEQVRGVLEDNAVVIIHDTLGGGFCLMYDAVNELYNEKAPTAFNVAEGSAARRQEVRRRAPNVSLPQLWITGVCKGSHREVNALLESGELASLVNGAVSVKESRPNGRSR